MNGLQSQVSSALDAGEYTALGSLLDREELQDPALFESPEWPHAVHILAHAYVGKLEDARFVYKRAPTAAKSANSPVNAAFLVLQNLWNSQYDKLWASLDYAWPAQLQGLVAALRGRMQDHALDLIATAYSTISVAKLSSLVGASESDAKQVALQRGWTEDSSTAGTVYLIPVPPQPASPHAATEADLTRLAQYVVFLQEGEAVLEAAA